MSILLAILRLSRAYKKVALLTFFLFCVIIIERNFGGAYDKEFYF
jgi:hypothetical protein